MMEKEVDYQFDQRGRRVSVGIAAVLGVGMTVLGLAHGGPWYFIAVTALSAVMALATFVQNSHSGLRLEGDTLTLFKDQWRHVVDVKTIRRVRTTSSMEGQPSIWLEFDDAPPYRLPGYCFGSAEPLKDAFRKRGIIVV